MPDAKSPAGPGKPLTEARERADEREQIEETLADAEERAKRTGSTSAHADASPQTSNESLPDEPTRGGGDKGAAQ